MKKKLLFCAYDLNVGGIENALINLLHNIDYNKYDVTVILEKKQGIFLENIPHSVNVQEYKISEHKNIVIRKLLNLYKRFVWAVANYKKYDFSCCYATYSLPCNLLSRLASKNCAIYIHSNYKYVYSNDINKINQFFLPRKLDKFRKVIFVSNEARRDLCEIYPNIQNKSIVINNFVDYEKVLALSKQEIDILKPKNKKVFVFVGRFDEDAKKLTRLVKTFSILCEKRLDLELWMIGDGQDYEMVKEYIELEQLSDKIKLLGQKKNPYAYMFQADYVILTSDYEGFPVVYNEAIILNKPIISTIDVSDDYIRIPNRFGYIVSKKENKMAVEIEQILDENLELEKIDFEKINNEKMNTLEQIFEGVI